MTASQPASPATAETPSTAVKAGLLPIAGQGIILMVAFLAGLVVKAGNGGGMQDLGAVATVIFGLEIVLGIGTIVLAMIRFRRGRQYTGVGLMGGWIVGILLALLITQLA